MPRDSFEHTRRRIKKWSRSCWCQKLWFSCSSVLRLFTDKPHWCELKKVVTVIVMILIYALYAHRACLMIMYIIGPFWNYYCYCQPHIPKSKKLFCYSIKSFTYQKGCLLSCSDGTQLSTRNSLCYNIWKWGNQRNIRQGVNHKYEVNKAKIKVMIKSQSPQYLFMTRYLSFFSKKPDKTETANND